MASSLALVQRHLYRGLPRAAWFAALWWVVTLGDRASWIIGVPAVLVVSWVSVALFPERPWRCRVWGAVRFLVYFLWQSVVGGCDVAFRALYPNLLLDAGFHSYRLRLPEGPAQIFLVNTVSLLPGTLSAAVQEDQLTVHVLDTTQPIDTQLQRLEDLVASFFNVQLCSNTTHRT